MTEHNDKPRAEIMAMADKAILEFKSKGAKDVWVHFKFTCAHCGERCTFQDKNMLWEEGECAACGKMTKVEKAGFSLEVKLR